MIDRRIVFAALSVGAALFFMIVSVFLAEPVSEERLVVSVESTPTITPSPTVASVQGIAVSRVVDGDTIVLADGSKVRYIGIDAPESVKSGHPIECLGLESAARNRALVEGKTVTLEKDVRDDDGLGRLLRYVYVDGVMVNEALVREGLAKSSAYPPDMRHQARIRAAQGYAQAHQIGMWSTVCR